jgi:predicted lipid carrier protein YhbT
VNLLGLKNNPPLGQHIEDTCQTLKDEADLDIDQLLSVPLDRFIQVLQENKAMNDANLDRFAAILFHIAENTEDKDKATLFYERSLIIYGYLDHSSDVYSFDRSYYLEQIRKVLSIQRLHQ